VAAVLAVCFGSLANAQSASISANATVISELTVTNQANLNFGTVVVGQTKSLDGYGNVAVSSGPKLGNARQGHFKVTAQRGSNLQLTFNLPTNLIAPGGAELPISFSYEDEQVAVVSDPLMGDFINFYPTTLLQINNFLTGSEDFATYVDVFIGGQVNATGVTAGAYTGTITLSATYN